MKKNYPPINLGSPGEEISPKDLHAIIQRFKNLNKFQLQKVQDFLQPRQRVFLDLLALIFHQNQALLPGFVSTETATGIPDYTPNKQTIQTAKQFSKSYRYTRIARRNRSIEGIFLMGSVGTIAFSKTSDMDIWLCHSPSLNAGELTGLQAKATALEQWAQSLSLEVHFFLMNSEQFRQGHTAPLSSESSGKTQHYLLLEEFYRTAIYVAGKVPSWWIVPPHQEHNYTGYIQHLMDYRFISKHEVIDFGGLESVPAKEFISATLWHIYKSLGSPYKSLLKLFLMECYASEYPEPQWIAQSRKKAIYEGKFDLEKLDPYLLIYEKVEEYLNLVASQKRLALARRCFYLKIMGSSAKSLDPKSRIFREQYLQNIAQQWNWPDDMLESFKHNRFWDITKATEEHVIVRDQLKQCLRMILSFSGKHVEGNYRNNIDLKLIGRKLGAFLEQKPGKVEIITTRSSIYKKEETLSVIELDQDHALPVWHLYSGYVDIQTLDSASPLKKGDSLLNIFCWLRVNGLYRRNLKLHIVSHSLNINSANGMLMLNQIDQFLSDSLDSQSDSLEVYNHPNQLLSSLLFINLGKTFEQQDDDQFIMSHRSDPLSYGENRQCFVQTIDQISVSSWGEIILSKHDGLEGLFNCLVNTFNQSKTPLSNDRLHVYCYTPLRGASIALRVKTIFTSLTEHFAKPSAHRYILPGKNSYYLFKKLQTLQYTNIETNDLLLQELSSTQSQYSHIYFDDYVLSKTIIPYLYSLNISNTIQIFYHTLECHVAIYIIDEKAALFSYQHRKTEPAHLLPDYLSFVEGLQNQAKLSNDIKTQVYEIQDNSAGVISCNPVSFKPLHSFMDLNIRITADPSGQNSGQLTIFCNDQEFSASNSQNIFEAIRNHILAFRKSTDDYPFHINEIDVPSHILGVDDITQAHTIHYLKYKLKIESLLNNK